MEKTWWAYVPILFLDIPTNIPYFGDMRIYNENTKQIEELQILDSNQIKMYVCGPTVYDRVHLGNARSAVVFDTLFRVLHNQYGQVVYARNFTDIDDKIIARAAEMQISPQQLASEAINWYNDDINFGLEVLQPNFMPRATDFIDQMILDIKKIIRNGAAYATNDGHVYYRTEPDLNGKSIRALHGGNQKERQSDFVLWKPAKEGEPSWRANFGEGLTYGRPGWHIECSTMATRLLGHNFDIHGGGSDLAFPHHHNECLQAKSMYPSSNYATYWMHNGMLTVNGEKMSKSLGNFITVRDLLDRNIPGPAIRMALLSTHYRASLDWSDGILDQMVATWRYWKEVTTGRGEYIMTKNTPLNEDLNTPEAFAYMHQLAHDGKFNDLKAMMRVMGITTWWNEFSYEFKETMQSLINKRKAARDDKNYALSDKIRADLTLYGIQLLDVPEGMIWRASGVVDQEGAMRYDSLV